MIRFYCWRFLKRPVLAFAVGNGLRCYVFDSYVSCAFLARGTMLTCFVWRSVCLVPVRQILVDLGQDADVDVKYWADKYS